MVVEHVFVTTLDGEPAMHWVANMLTMAGYAVYGVSGEGLRAHRGTGGLMNHRVAELPHDIHVTFDRGRVTVGVAILARADQDMSVHGMVGASVAKAVEQLLVHGSPIEQCVGYLRRVDAMAGKPWPVMNKISIGCLIAVGGFIALIVLIALIGVMVGH